VLADRVLHILCKAARDATLRAAAAAHIPVVHQGGSQ
jgi:hypothetical protein